MNTCVSRIEHDGLRVVGEKSENDVKVLNAGEQRKIRGDSKELSVRWEWWERREAFCWWEVSHALCTSQ